MTAQFWLFAAEAVMGKHTAQNKLTKNLDIIRLLHMNSYNYHKDDTNMALN